MAATRTNIEKSFDQTYLQTIYIDIIHYSFFSQFCSNKMEETEKRLEQAENTLFNILDLFYYKNFVFYD